MVVLLAYAPGSVAAATLTPPPWHPTVGLPPTKTAVALPQELPTGCNSQ